MTSTTPNLDELLKGIKGDKPIAFVLAGHNGSGKSTLWYEKLSNSLQIPLVNADRMMMSILPDPDCETRLIPEWARQLRDDDARWQGLTQEAISLFRQLIIDRQMPFAFETVFSHWKPRSDGSYESKIDDITSMQKAGYVVVLLFVGLHRVDLSILRVATRKALGGHGVDTRKLIERFPRTQQAIAQAAKIADMTLMFDNSRGLDQAFTLVRAQRKLKLLYDARAPQYQTNPEFLNVITPWLDKVGGTNLPAKIPGKIE